MRDKLLCAGDIGLAILSLTNPQQPQLEKCVSTGVLSGTGPCALEVVGDLTYLAGGGGLAMIDNLKISTARGTA